MGPSAKFIVAFAVIAAVAAPASHATYVGDNGAIAFDRYDSTTGAGGIWLVNEDGSGSQPLVAGDNPAWSPDGSKLAFGCPPPNNTHVCTADADGSSVSVIPNLEVYPQDEPAWSPDGTKLVIASGNMCGSGCFYSDIWRIDATNGSDAIRMVPNGISPSWSANRYIAYADFYAFYQYPPTEIHVVHSQYPGGSAQLTQADDGGGPDWSPDGETIVFSSRRDGNTELYVMNADGSAQTRLTTNTASDFAPSWSPDGTRIVFVRNAGTGTNNDLFLINPDGSGETQLTNTPGVTEASPAWRPVPQPGYVRPKGATPARIPLVPAFEPCEAPNRTHGPPLSHPSCAPPDPRAGFMTFGSAPAGSSPKASGHVRLDALPGAPGSPNDADVRIVAQLADVRRGFDLADGPGSLELHVPVRLTDKHNGAFDSEQGTMQDFELTMLLPCVETADATVGSTCSATTTANALIPQGFPRPSSDFVSEGYRAIWGLGQISVWDGGEDGYIESTDDNTVLAVQGVFVP